MAGRETAIAASHQLANEIVLEAIKVARRDGRTPSERCAIYDREIERLNRSGPRSI